MELVALPMSEQLPAGLGVVVPDALPVDVLLEVCIELTCAEANERLDRAAMAAIGITAATMSVLLSVLSWRLISFFTSRAAETPES